MVESSVHEHVAALAPGKLNNLVQAKEFVYPPLIVAESKLTNTLLPSLLKAADLSCGTGGVA